MPSPFHGDRLNALRTEAGWSQADLADHIGSDARQVSRHENSRVAPSLDVLVKIADTLDYLLIDNATRRPLSQANDELAARLPDLATLTDDERTTITNVIDALITKTKTPRHHRRSRLSHPRRVIISWISLTEGE